MTLLPDWPVTLSSLGEASISYPQQVIRQLSSLTRGYLYSTLLETTSKGKDHLSLLFNEIVTEPTTSPWTLAAVSLTAIIGIVILIAMSWRDTFGFFRRSSSNYSHNAQQSGPPQVSDSDYTYLTNDDIVEPPRSYGQVHSHGAARPTTTTTTTTTTTNYSEDAAPDILLLKHRGVTYPLHFPAYAIDDGALTVGEVRRLAAEKTGTPDLGRIRMLYKGKLLRDDAQRCKDEGLRQQSEIMCVVSEVGPGESSGSPSASEAGNQSEGLSLDSRSTDHRQSPPSPDGVFGFGKKKGNKKNKKKRDKKQQQQQQSPSPSPLQQHLAPDSRFPEPARSVSSHNNLAPPSDVRPTSSGRASATPSPAPSLQQFSTAIERVDALLRYLRAELKPRCETYLSHPPTDAKLRSHEHKLLNETILSQVILKADGIDSEDARPARRALIKEAQALLNRLDAVSPQ